LKYCALVCICLLSLGGLLSCGLEAFYYIDYIQWSDYTDTSSSISLPSRDREGYATYFNSFIIFYRIYISGEFIDTGDYLRDTSSARSLINATLDTDYNRLNPYTDTLSTSVNTSNLESTFFNSRYFLLTLENANINNVLGSDSLGQRLDIAFPPNPGAQPTLTVNGVSYVLKRAVEAPANQTLVFNPVPATLDLLNHPDLYDRDKAHPNATNINVDVVANSATAEARYTYVSMYIAARGTSLEMPPSTIYSQPTFIGIFRLANS